jgi:outer membrane lipoprotein-sorting protein
MKKLGTPLIALTAAAAMFVTACAEANTKAQSANEQGHQRKARVADVTNSQQQQGSLHPEADYDFGDAAAYYNLHPEGGK